MVGRVTDGVVTVGVVTVGGGFGVVMVVGIAGGLFVGALNEVVVGVVETEGVV